MRSEKGITLASLGIYIVVILIALITLATITAYFQSNVNEFNTKTTVDLEFDKFNLYFIEEVKKTNNKIDETNSNETKVLFTSGNTYEFSDNSIILNGNVKIAEKISACRFSFSTDENNIQSVTVYMKVGDTERTNQYTLSNQTTENVANDEDYIYGYKRVEGTNLLTLENSIETSLKDYKIYGNSVQESEPSPNAPIEIESVGDKTKNLLNIDEGLNDALTTNGTGEYTITRTDSNRFSKSININLKAGTTYVMSYELIDTNTSYYYSLQILGSSYYNGIPLTSNYCVFTPTVDITSLQLYQEGQMPVGTYTTFKNLQIEEATAATEYEPYGYKIPVKVSGKNLFNENKIYAYNSYFNSTGNILTTAGTTIYGLYELNKKEATLLINSYNYDAIDKTIRVGLYKEGVFTRKEFILTNSNKYTIPSGYDEVMFFWYDNLKPEVQLEEGNTATEYEPYVEPIKTNIYLDEPLRKIGDYADYIDFEKQKVFKNVSVIDNTGTLTLEESLQGITDNMGTNIELPTIPTYNGTTILELDTEIPPSNTEVVYYSK